MRSAYAKDIVRSIRHSLGRFLAILGIVALGVGFYSGLRMTAPDMRLAADAYYDGTALMDIRVVSSLGMTDDDMDSLRAVEGVEQVMPAYEADAVTVSGKRRMTVRIHSLSRAAITSDTSDGVNALSDDENYLNRPILASGRWPEASNECVVSADRVTNDPIQIGETITATECAGDLDSTLAETTFTVVGTVHSAYYACSSSLGTTSVGSGTIAQFLYVLGDAFSPDYPYTEAFITVAGARELNCSTAEYDSAIAAVQDRIKELAPEREQARLQGLQNSAQDELDSARADYLSERSSVEQQLGEAQETLDQSRATLEESEAQAADAAAQIAAGRVALQEAEAQLEESRAQLEESRAQLEQNRSQLAAQRAEYDSSAAALAAQWQAAGLTPAEAPATLEYLQQQLALLPDIPAYAQARAKLQVRIAGLQLLMDSQQQLEAAAQQLAAAQAQLAAAQAQLEGAQAQLAAGQKELEAKQAQLAESEARLAAGYEEISQGWHAYDEGAAAYESAVAEARSGFASAEAQLSDAQAAIDDLSAPEWLVMTREQNYGVVSFYSDADRMDHIAAIFPLIFFLVAALVALTTMTRMVDEERSIIGTYKALGYGRGRIAAKYLLYAALASGVGSVLGIALLAKLLPAVIMTAYAIIYYVPFGALAINWPLALLATGIGMGVTLFATLAAALATFREKPAALLQPRAPAAGKRILLERMTSLWRRVSFLWKVTFRNLFRYKKRLFMTIVGIAGCTALLLTGLGLRNSINDIIDVQFGELTKYNVIVSVESGMTDEAHAQLDGILYGDRLSGTVPLAAYSALASGPDAKDMNVTVTVPASAAGMQELFIMRNRVTGEPLSLTDEGTEVLVSEKLANKAGVKVGGTITLGERDTMGNATGVTHEATVTGIMENYVGNYVYMGAAQYERVFGEAPSFRTYYSLASDDAAEREKLTDDIRAIDGVRTVGFNDTTISAYRTMLKSVDLIVWVLVIAAGALAFIVLYNLTNINITERIREIATLKVLGFTRREVQSYIYRENVLLSALGALLGLVLGVFLEGFVVATAEVDQVMFGRAIHVESFVLAFVLTMLFTAFVMLFMRPKLAKVDMVESLKSNE